MRRPTRGDEQGLVGVVLTIVIVFALVAVIMLTRTLEAAQQIDSTVKDIKGSLVSANGHLNTGCTSGSGADCSTALPVLMTTEGLVDKINTAAAPLAGDAGHVVTDVNSINSSVTTILQSASSINSTVHSINASALSIGNSVNSINASFNGINADVITIHNGLIRASAQADSVVSLVDQIKGDTSTINGLAGGILSQATAICTNKLLIGDQC